VPFPRQRHIVATHGVDHTRTAWQLVDRQLLLAAERDAGRDFEVGEHERFEHHRAIGAEQKRADFLAVGVRTRQQTLHTPLYRSSIRQLRGEAAAIHLQSEK
jgi:hypothetical protein